jgi:hypothetical protein
LVELYTKKDVRTLQMRKDEEAYTLYYMSRINLEILANFYVIV